MIPLKDKIGNALAKLTRGEVSINKISDVKGVITDDTNGIQNMTRPFPTELENLRKLV